MMMMMMMIMVITLAGTPLVGKQH